MAKNKIGGLKIHFYSNLKNGKRQTLCRNIKKHRELVIFYFHFREIQNVSISECFLGYQELCGVSTKCQWSFYLATDSYEKSFALEPLRKMQILTTNYDVWAIGDPRHENSIRNLCFSAKSGFPPPLGLYLRPPPPTPPTPPPLPLSNPSPWRLMEHIWFWV